MACQAGGECLMDLALSRIVTFTMSKGPLQVKHLKHDFFLCFLHYFLVRLCFIANS